MDDADGFQGLSNRVLRVDGGPETFQGVKWHFFTLLNEPPMNSKTSCDDYKTCTGGEHRAADSLQLTLLDDFPTFLDDLSQVLDDFPIFWMIFPIFWMIFIDFPL